MDTVAAEKVTTINISRETWRRMNLLRLEPREKYDDVLRRLLDVYERESAERPQERESA